MNFAKPNKFPQDFIFDAHVRIFIFHYLNKLELYCCVCQQFGLEITSAWFAKTEFSELMYSMIIG
jgi:hypothetical protein